MDPLPPIPTPVRTQLRQMRETWVPPGVFLVCLVAALFLWRQNVFAPHLVGEAEVVIAEVSCPFAGSLTELKVARYDQVSAGDVIAKLIITDPAVLEASLGVIKAELELLRKDMAPVLDSQRNAISYERLSMDWLKERISLASARVKLQYAEGEFQRVTRLFEDKLISEDALELAKSNRDALAVEVEEMNKLMAEVEPKLQSMQTNNPALNNGSPQEALRAAIAVEEEKLRLTEAQLKPILLKSPINGRVTMIYRRNGENLPAGTPVVTIAAETSERIVAFLRQPLTIAPTAGMPVDVRTRNSKREVARSSIVAVGNSWETVDLTPGQSLSRPIGRPAPTSNPELGLPIMVSLPASLKIRPGELVDLTILPVGTP